MRTRDLKLNHFIVPTEYHGYNPKTRGEDSHLSLHITRIINKIIKNLNYI